MAGFGKKACSMAGGNARGGVPKIRTPRTSGRALSASSATWPPKLQPTRTAGSISFCGEAMY